MCVREPSRADRFPSPQLHFTPTPCLRTIIITRCSPYKALTPHWGWATNGHRLASTQHQPVRLKLTGRQKLHPFYFKCTLYHMCMILMILLSGQRKVCSKIVTAWPISNSSYFFKGNRSLTAWPLPLCLLNWRIGLGIYNHSYICIYLSIYLSIYLALIHFIQRVGLMLIG
jgi:hypothetical protein